MKRLKNQDGATILWAMLLTVILTLLLTSILTLALSYYNATLNTVKNQQAYFTARSAADAIEEALADENAAPKFMPSGIGSANAVNVTNFGFDQNKMGSANATIIKTNTTTLEVNVYAKYRDQSYNLKTTITKQPIYFGGIAVKSLNTGSHTFTLGDKTDLYIGDGDKTNIPFDFYGSLNIGGNFICEGNINFLSSPESYVNKHKVTGNIYNTITDGNPRKKIWSSTEYIMSNYSLNVDYPALNTSAWEIFKSLLLFNLNLISCDSDINWLGQQIDYNVSLFNYSVNSNSARYIVIYKVFDSTLNVKGIAYSQHQSDDVVPNTYVKVNDHITVNIKYATNKVGWFYDALSADSSFINVYLDEYSTLALGKNADPNSNLSKDFHMNIYGGKGSKVYLYDGVTVNGSINVDNLYIVGDNVKFNYSTADGTNVSKKQIDSLWLNAGYDKVQ